MKKIRFFIATIIAIVINISSFAQIHDHSNTSNSNTEKIKVLGNCEMCQQRIEKVARIDGVTKASWDKDNKILTLVYNPSKVNSDDVQKRIATAGHDTEKYKADDKSYNGLPACCKYERRNN